MIDYNRVANNALTILVIIGFFYYILLQTRGEKVSEWFKGIFKRGE